MPEAIDTPEEIEAHKAHIIKQPKTCDLCWMEVEFTEEEMNVINSVDN